MLTSFHRNWIGISGKRESGKDTVARLLVNYLRRRDESYGKSIHVLAIADSLKDEYCTEHGISREQLDKDKHIYRSDLQHKAEDARVKEPDIWIRKLFAKVGSLPQENSYIIITDVRHRVEADILHNRLGAHLWRVVRPSVVRDLPVDKHTSEIDLDGWVNYTGMILNNCHMDTLKKRVERLADVWLEHQFTKE